MNFGQSWYLEYPFLPDVSAVTRALEGGFFELQGQSLVQKFNGANLITYENAYGLICLMLSYHTSKPSNDV